MNFHKKQAETLTQTALALIQLSEQPPAATRKHVTISQLTAKFQISPRICFAITSQTLRQTIRNACKNI